MFSRSQQKKLCSFLQGHWKCLRCYFINDDTFTSSNRWQVSILCRFILQNILLIRSTSLLIRSTSLFLFLFAALLKSQPSDHSSDLASSVGQNSLEKTTLKDIAIQNTSSVTCVWNTSIVKRRCWTIIPATIRFSHRLLKHHHIIIKNIRHKS